MARSIKEVHTINYYPINEGAARRAKEMNSFSDYKEGSATAEYRAMVDKAAAIAEQQKSRVDPMYHEKIDHLLDTYARKLAENMNQGFAIDARVPSMMIAGPANFPVGKKEKQNRARDSNMEEWRYIQGLLDKIRSTGMGGISADDPAAIEKLQKKLDGLERSCLLYTSIPASKIKFFYEDSKLIFAAFHDYGGGNGGGSYSVYEIDENSGTVSGHSYDTLNENDVLTISDV